LIGVIVNELKATGGFTRPSSGIFTVKKEQGPQSVRTGEPVKVKVGKTVRFKASPSLERDLNRQQLALPPQLPETGQGCTHS
jgi:DNA-binding protein HU-beta